MNVQGRIEASSHDPATRVDVIVVPDPEIEDCDEAPLVQCKVWQPDVRQIRKSACIEMTQREFAQRYGLSLGAVRHWEQGVVVPSGTSRTLLWLIEQYPTQVLSMLDGDWPRKGDPICNTLSKSTSAGE